MAGSLDIPNLYQDTAGTGTAVTSQLREVGYPGAWEMVGFVGRTVGMCSTSREMFKVLDPPDTEHI